MFGPSPPSYQFLKPMSASASKNADLQDLRRAMERFDDKLDKSFQNTQDIRVEIERLSGRITTHEANVKTGMSDLAGKMEQARSAADLKSESTKSSISEIKAKDALRWGVLIAIGALLLDILASVVKNYLSRVIK